MSVIKEFLNRIKTSIPGCYCIKGYLYCHDFFERSHKLDLDRKFMKYNNREKVILDAGYTV